MTDTRPHPSRPHLRALTGLRFLAAALVVFYHLRHLSVGGAPEWVQRLVGAGQVGVTLFFVLSGFILTYTYAQGGEQTVSRAQFWRARFARIYPVYALGLGLTLPFFLRDEWLTGVSRADVVTLGAAPLLLQAWTPQTACLWNCPGWSLSAEAFFYALFPLLLMGPWWRRWPAWPTALGLWACALLPSLVLVLTLPQPFPDPSVAVDFTYYTPLARLPEFLLGMVLGGVFLGGRFSVRWAGLSSVTGLAGTLAVMLAEPPFGLNAIRNGLTLPFAALLILGLAFGRGPLARLLGLGGLVVLGEASYSLYILHAPVYQWMREAWGHVWPDRVLGAGFFWVYLGVLVPLSIVTYRFVERPAQRWLRGSRGAGADSRRPSGG